MAPPRSRRGHRMSRAVHPTQASSPLDIAQIVNRADRNGNQTKLPNDCGTECRRGNFEGDMKNNTVIPNPLVEEEEKFARVNVVGDRLVSPPILESTDELFRNEDDDFEDMDIQGSRHLECHISRPQMRASTHQVNQSTNIRNIAAAPPQNDTRTRIVQVSRAPGGAGGNSGRGSAYTLEETMTILSIMRRRLPIGGQEWESVVEEHYRRFGDKERTAESLRRKFNSLNSRTAPTGDPTVPHEVLMAKQVEHDIIERTNMTTATETPGPLGIYRTLSQLNNNAPRHAASDVRDDENRMSRHDIDTTGTVSHELHDAPRTSEANPHNYFSLATPLVQQRGRLRHSDNGDGFNQLMRMALLGEQQQRAHDRLRLQRAEEREERRIEERRREREEDRLHEREQFLTMIAMIAGRSHHSNMPSHHSNSS